MSAGVEPESGVIYESILFRGPSLEISYTEPQDRGEGVALVKTLVLDPRKVEPEHAQFIAALQEMLDAGLTVLRNPPARV